MNYPDLSELNNIKISERYILKHFPEFHKYISQTFYDVDKWQEKLYLFYNNLMEPPKCPICGKPLKLNTFFIGYQKFCSKTCAYKSEDRSNKIIQTQRERYGGVGFESKELLEKTKQTNLERYGYECSSLSPEIQNKIKQTNLERYGCENPQQNKTVNQKSVNTQRERYGGVGFESKELLEKTKQTNLERYGYDNPVKNKEIKEDLQNKIYKKFIEEHPDIISREDKTYTCKCPHLECNQCSDKTYQIGSNQYWVRIHQNEELCTKLFPIGYHNKITNIETFCHKILDNHNIEYETNNRTVLDKHRELDIYMPSKKLAIECNGVYWHSTNCVNNNYHYNKWKECLQKGIQLLTIWEDQIILKPKIVESIILSKLGVYNERIGARKCEIREVSSRESAIFLNENHLQGVVNSRVRLGLYYNNELMSLMTFGSKRKCMNGRNEQWELHRYCNKRGVQVVGGASKLFKYFINTYNPTSIESFSSNDISNGELYRQLGFECNGSQYSSYWYIKTNPMARYHRYDFRKDILVKKGYDPSKSESQIMSERGYYRIYDSGQTKWSFKLL